MNFDSSDRQLLDLLIPASNNQPSLSCVLDRQILSFRFAEELGGLLHWYLSIAKKFLVPDSSDVQVVLNHLGKISVHKTRRLIYLIVEVYVSDKQVFAVLYESDCVLSSRSIILYKGDIDELVLPVLAASASYRPVKM